MRILPTTIALMAAAGVFLSSTPADAFVLASFAPRLAPSVAEAPWVQKVGSAGKACKNSAKSAGLHGKALRRSTKACLHKGEPTAGSTNLDAKQTTKHDCKRQGKVAGLRGDALRQSVRACMGKSS
jgi:hypothetical protein